VTVEENHPRLQISTGACPKVKAQWSNLISAPSPLITIHPGPTWPVKEWPRKSWVALIAELRRHGYANIVQLGTARHLALGEAKEVVLPDVVSLVDQLTLEETIALVSQSSLLVGVDSGLLHAAAALQIPTVGLWGATAHQYLFSSANARSFVTSPVACQGCHHRVPREHWITGCPHDIQCMKQITVGEVLQACLGRLEEAAAGKRGKI
jgi:heptosyltransferase-1